MSSTANQSKRVISNKIVRTAEVSHRKKVEGRVDFAEVKVKDSSSGKTISTTRVFLLAE